MMGKIRNIDLVELLILIMPVIDILNTITGISLSLLYRGIFLIILLFYFLFINKSDIKKTSFVLLILFCVFSGVFLFHYFNYLFSKLL